MADFAKYPELVWLIRQDPAHMRPPEAPLPGRVDIFFPVRFTMVNPMMRSPPQSAFLCRSLGKEGHQELRNPSQPVAPMAEVPVIARSDAEHA